MPHCFHIPRLLAVFLAASLAPIARGQKLVAVCTLTPAHGSPDAALQCAEPGKAPVGIPIARLDAADAKLCGLPIQRQPRTLTTVELLPMLTGLTKLTVTAQVPNTLLISQPAALVTATVPKNKKKAAPPSRSEVPDSPLDELKKNMQLLLSTVPATPIFSLDLDLPHPGALSASFLTDLKSLHPEISVLLARDRLLLSTGGMPECPVWNSFVSDVRRLVWGGPLSSPVLRISAVTASDLATALNGAATPPAGSTTPNAGIATSFGPNLLVINEPLADTSPAAQLLEKRRVAAVLDLPQPEVLVNAWILQNSSNNERTIASTGRVVREAVAEFNEGLEGTTHGAWTYLSSRIAENKQFFDEPFHGYLAHRVLFSGNVAPSVDQTADEMQRRFVAEQSSGAPGLSEALGACRSDGYCLGYTDLFDPLKPRLTDLLMALVAAKDPITELECSVDAAENRHVTAQCPSPASLLNPPPADYCEGKSLDKAQPRDKDVCKIWKGLQPIPGKLTDDVRQTAARCEVQDYRGVLQSMADHHPEPSLNCFRRRAELAFSDKQTLGLVRGAIADFLFNYKMSQQYPHEFSPYDLTASANTLNSSLRPFIDEFNRDVTAFQSIMKQAVALRVEHANGGGGWFEKTYLVSNNLVTINTIANQAAKSDTVTESYLEALSFPAATSVLNSLVSGATGGGSASSAVSGGFGALLSGGSANIAQAAAAGAANFQSSRIHVGRELSVSVTPQSINGGSSAELQVDLRADDSGANGAAYSSGGPGTGGTGDAELSRLSKSDTTTRIRVDSLKMFEVSTFSSTLEGSKRRIPLILPLVELPYIGSLISVPVKPAREFHTSVAVISAIVIPTSADLAFGYRFTMDKILVGEEPRADGRAGLPCTWPSTDAKIPACRVRPTASLQDFGGLPVREFNHAMVHCLVVGSPYGKQEGGAASTPCALLSYKDVLIDSP